MCWQQTLCVVLTYIKAETASIIVLLTCRLDESNTGKVTLIAAVTRKMISR